MGWVWHGPAGRGEAFVAALDAEARPAVDQIGLPGIQVRMARDPIRRIAIMSGPADDIQREGMGSEMGLSDYVRAVPGMSGVHWRTSPAAPAACRCSSRPGSSSLLPILSASASARCFSAAAGANPFSTEHI